MADESITQQDPFAAQKAQVAALIERAFQLREALLPHEAAFRALANDIAMPEAVANVILAFRHLEDCRMRLGKAVQALNGGTSVYPR